MRKHTIAALTAGLLALGLLTPAGPRVAPTLSAQNTALNRTTVALLTNKSGGTLAAGAVVVLDNTNAKGFTTTTTAGLSTRGIGVVLEPNGIANNATGLVALGGWVPKLTLNTAATVGQFIKTHTVAGQGTPHSSPQVEGDFAVALQASATPEAILFGMANPVTGGSVTNTGTLTAGRLIQGNGTVDVTVSLIGLGALVTKAADQTAADYSTGSGVVVPWTTEDHDDSTFHDNSTNNSRLTIPSGAVRCDLTANVHLTSVTAGVYTSIQFLKNGAAEFVGTAMTDSATAGVTSRQMNIKASDVPCTSGDYFEVLLFVQTDTSITVETNYSSFAVQLAK